MTPTPARSQRSWSGRNHELAVLSAGLDELEDGRGALFTVTGEPGIGKSRLCDEVGRVAASRGLGVHWGRAWEAGGAPSFWPFVQVVRSIHRREPDLARNALRHGPSAALSELVPELMPRSGPAATTRDDHAHKRSDRFELFDAVTSFVRTVADARPQVVVLDDLHAADPSTLLLLKFLVRELASMRVVVLATHRDADARITPEVRRLLGHVGREGRTLPLARLDRDEVGALVAQATGAPAAADRLADVYRYSEGNPLFVLELLRLDRAAAHRADGIRELLRERLARLPAPVRAVMDAAAILGREVAVDPLATITEQPARELSRVLGAAADAGIVEPMEHSGAWRFTHVLLQERLYDDLAPARRTELHRAAATELAARPGGPPLAELAHHLLAAVPSVDAGDAVDAVLRASARAMDVLAFEDASALLERALALVEPVPAEAVRTFEVMLALGAARIRGADVERGAAMCRRACALARALGDGARLARAVLASTYEFSPGVHHHETIDLLAEALAMLPPGDSALRARCMAQLAAERQPEPDGAVPIELAHAAIAMARRVGDPATLRFTLAVAGMTMVIGGSDPRERTRNDRELLQLATPAGDRHLVVRAHLFLATSCAERGDRAGCDAHIASYASLVAAHRHSRFGWTAVSLGMARALCEGRFDDAEREFRRVQELGRADETLGWSMVATPIVLACAAERFDELPRLESATRAAFGALGHALGVCLGEMLIARLYAAAGDHQRTATQLAAIRAHPIFGDIRTPPWLAFLVEPCHLLGDRELAARLYDTLLPRAPWFYGLGPLAIGWEPPYTRQLGLLAHTLGRLDDAVSHLTDAAERTARAGMHSHVARVRYELACALLARGAAGDVDRARSVLEEARAQAVALGQDGLLARIDRGAGSVASVPVADVPIPINAAPPVDLRREGDYWAIAWGGRTLRLRDGRGVQVLDRLLATPNQELHVLQLVSADARAADTGDAGVVLDDEAVRQYRARLVDLREQLDEAESFADLGRAERARTEIEQLTGELTRAVGLGGKRRRAKGAAERARTTVQKRLRHVIKRIERDYAALGRHLDQSIRTGMFCGYFPAGRPRDRAPSDS